MYIKPLCSLVVSVASRRLHRRKSPHKSSLTPLPPFTGRSPHRRQVQFEFIPLNQNTKWHLVEHANGPPKPRANNFPSHNSKQCSTQTPYLSPFTCKADGRGRRCRPIFFSYIPVLGAIPGNLLRNNVNFQTHLRRECISNTSSLAVPLSSRRTETLRKHPL